MSSDRTKGEFTWKALLALTLGVTFVVSTLVASALVTETVGATGSYSGSQCPLSASGDDILIDLGTDFLRSDKDDKKEKGPFSVDIPAGTYEVVLASYDDHTSKPDQTQPHEEWYLELNTLLGSKITETNAIGDLADNRDYRIESVNTALVISKTVKKVTAKHAAYKDTSSPNSVVPRCAVFKKIEEPKPAPVCTLTADDTDIKKGDSTKIRWTSDHVISAKVDNGQGTQSVAVAKNGSRNVTPSDTTTYTGTYIGENGDTIECDVTVKVKALPPPPVPPTPKTATCELFSDHEWTPGGSTNLTEGDTAKIWWTTTNAWTIPDGYLRFMEKKPLTGENLKPNSGTVYEGLGSKVFNLNTSESSGYWSVTPSRNTDFWAYLYNGDDEIIDSCIVEIDLKKKPKEPSCDAMSLIIDDVNRGKSHTVTQGTTHKVGIQWNTSNVDHVEFDGHSLSADGSYDIGEFAINSNKQYELEVFDLEGKEIEHDCRVKLKVESPPCTMCGGGQNQPRVELTQRYTPATTSPLAFVSLSQVPYTGFEASPLATALFWAIVVLWSIAVGYSLMVRGTWQRAFASLIPSPYTPEFAPPVMAGGYSGPSGTTDYEEEEQDSSVSIRGIPPMNLPGSDAPTPSFEREQKASRVESRPVASILEEMAYAEKVLVSADAVRAISVLALDRMEDTSVTMKTVIDKAKATYPRVDGWIHLTRERISALFPSATPLAATASLMPQAVAQASPQGTRQNTARLRAESVVPQGNVPAADAVALLALVTSGSEEQAFKTLRAHLAAGGSVQSLFADMAGALDGAYRSRIEGGPADSRIVERFASWKTEDIEGLLGILSGGLDYSYTTPQTAGKITLAKVFEFARTRSR